MLLIEFGVKREREKQGTQPAKYHPDDMVKSDCLSRFTDNVATAVPRSSAAVLTDRGVLQLAVL